MRAEKIFRLVCIAAAAGSILSACTASPTIQESAAPRLVSVDADDAPVIADMYAESPDPRDMEVYNFQVQTILEHYPELSVIGSIIQRGTAEHKIQNSENEAGRMAVAITCSGDGQWKMNSRAMGSIGTGSCGRHKVAVFEPQTLADNGTQLWELRIDEGQRAWLVFFSY